MHYDSKNDILTLTTTHYAGVATAADPSPWPWPCGRGWRYAAPARTSSLDSPPRPLGGRGSPWTASSTASSYPWRLHARDAGTVTCGWAAPCSSGIVWCPLTRAFPDGTDAAWVLSKHGLFLDASCLLCRPCCRLPTALALLSFASFLLFLGFNLYCVNGFCKHMIMNLWISDFMNYFSVSCQVLDLGYGIGSTGHGGWLTGKHQGSPGTSATWVRTDMRLRADMGLVLPPQGYLAWPRSCLSYGSCAPVVSVFTVRTGCGV